MPANVTELEDRLRAAYGDAASTVQLDDIAPDAPAPTRSARWRAPASGRRIAPLAAAAAVLAIVAAATLIPHALLGPPSTANLPAGVAYLMTGDRTIVPVDLATGHARTPIPLPGHGGVLSMVIPPHGSTAFVATFPGRLFPVDLARGKVGQPIALGGVTQDFLMTPNGRLGYALQPPFGVAVVNLATRSSIGFIKIQDAYHFAMTPNGKTVYVVGNSANHLTLTPIRTATNTALRPISLGPSGGPADGPGTHIVIGPGGRTAYLLVMLASGGAEIVPIDTASNTARKPIIVRKPTRDVFIAANGNTAYVMDLHGRLIPIDLITGKSRTAISLPHAKPQDLLGAVTATSRSTSTMYLLETYSDPSVVVPIDTATSTALKPLRIGSQRWAADALTFSPTGKTLYVFSTYRDMQPKSVPDETLMTQVRVSTGKVIRTTTLPGNGWLLVFPR